MPRGRANDAALPRSVGVLGPGFLASAIAERLLKTRPTDSQVVLFGHPTVDLERLASRGALQAASPADLAARCEIVLVLLDSLADLEEQLAGPSGLQAGVHSRTTIVVGSIAPPEALRVLADRVGSRSAGLLEIVDAPLSGPPAAATGGSLAILVGAAATTYERVRPVLERLGRPVRVGELGSAQIAHACAQYVVAATATALTEASVLAERAGLDLEAVLRSWDGSLAGSQLLTAGLQRMAGTPETVQIPNRAVRTPLDILEREADRTGIPLRLLSGVRQLLGALSRAGLDDHDLSEAYRLVAAHRVHTPPPLA